MTTMTSDLKVFPLVLILLSFSWSFFGQSREVSDAVKNIFLTKHFNSSESERILKSARENYLFLKDVEKKHDEEEKSNFVKNYANFLLDLLEEAQTKDVDVYQIFSKQNSFLKEPNVTRPSKNFNITELKSKIENLQFAIERHLTAHYNASEDCVEGSKVLSLNESRFDVFLKEKLREDYSEIGYFFLEVFATLIGLSWGLISTVIYHMESTSENIFQSSV